MSLSTLQKKVAFAPLVSTAQSEESYYLGASLTDLLVRYLASVGVSMIDYNSVARGLISSHQSLPLEASGAETLLNDLGADLLIYGVYIQEAGTKMLGIRLSFLPDKLGIPLETSAPIASLSTFLPRLTVSILERLNIPVSDDMRRKINQQACPANFEALDHISRARAAWTRGDHELALIALDSALAFDEAYEDAMFLEVMIARLAGDVETTQKAFKRWAQYAVRQGRLADGAERLAQLGHWLHEKGDWQAARTAYENALVLFGKADDKLGELRMSNNLTSLDLLQGKSLTVIRRYRRSLRDLEVAPEFQKDRATIYLNLGIAYKNQGQYHEAEQALTEAYNAVTSTDDVRLEGYILGQQGSLYADLDRWEAAQEAYTRALSLFMRSGDHIGKALVRTHQALLKRAQGDLRAAEAGMRAAVAELKEPDNAYVRAIIHYNMADLYFSLGEFAKAIPYAEKACQVFSSLNLSERGLATDLLEKVRSAAFSHQSPDNGIEELQQKRDFSQTLGEDIESL